MSKKADICLILEGTYPYVSGGVSTWTHELILGQPDKSFSIVSILPNEGEFEYKYELPDNVVSVTDIRLQELPESLSKTSRPFVNMETALNAFTVGKANLKNLETIRSEIDNFGGNAGQYQLIDSEEAWEVLVAMYDEYFSHSSFLDYFWSWRAIAGGIYSIMLADIPDAKIYHALSTGYAGLYAARAKMETGRPMIITEHGIYTNERRIEISSAEWLQDVLQRSLTIDKTKRSLRDLWIDCFINYSRVAYEAANEIITLFAGNQDIQIADGACRSKLKIIPNGIDVERFSSIKRKTKDKPTIALIGRVVPIKDVKSFIRACGLMRNRIHDFKAYIMGPTDEDEIYYDSCVEMVEYLKLEDIVEFTGLVKIDDYLGEIDVLVNTSISEAQPLTILEAGAAGIPSVATDVGACREMILGRDGEEPNFGEGGAIVPLSNPRATADAVLRLLSDNELYAHCSEAIRRRVAKFYNKETQNKAYVEIYDKFIS